MLEKEMERYKYGDEYRGPTSFAQKVKTVNFSNHDDSINGVYEIASDFESEEFKEEDEEQDEGMVEDINMI